LKAKKKRENLEVVFRKWCAQVFGGCVGKNLVLGMAGAVLKHASHVCRV
jgi:hypothetical protein